MSDLEDYRFKTHELLIRLDAATTLIMMLVAFNEMSGPAWDEAYHNHREAYDAWSKFVSAPQRPIENRI